MSAAEPKIVLVTQKTRLELLIHRHNTFGQAKFYIEHHGGDFADYQQEHRTYHQALEEAVAGLQSLGRLQLLDRDHVSSYLFGPQDLVVALGRDGLVANVLKYLETQPLIGVNPDPDRWDGCLLPFRAGELRRLVPEVISGRRTLQTVTLAQAMLNDGQSLCAVNDLFIGRRTHASARYSLHFGDRQELQSSSGIIVSTGMGSTGWLRSVLAGAAGIARSCGAAVPSLSEKFDKSSDFLYYTVREPYPSASTGAQLVFGRIDPRSTLQITSCMPENGVIFSDGMESDFLEFNSGSVATISVADRQGHLVV